MGSGGRRGLAGGAKKETDWRHTGTVGCGRATGAGVLQLFSPPPPPVPQHEIIA